MKDLIVVIDDEADLLELLEMRLSAVGFEVIGCLNTQMASAILAEEKVALMIVDRNLIGEEGSKFVKKLRKNGNDMPIIFLSALAEKEDIMQGFARGGDDYITKPFDFDLLVAKINALLWRNKNKSVNLAYKNLILNVDSRILRIDEKDGEKTIFLTQLESNILQCFLRNPNKVLSQEFLLERIWENHSQEKSVNVAIKRLRQKLSSDKNKYIKNIRLLGYMLV